MKKLAVVALGGNAILRENEIGSIEQQEANTYETLENLLFLVEAGYDLVITHGNGPQVGNILLRNDAGEQLYNVAQMPLDVCVADSQGGIGYMIERMMRNLLHSKKIERNVITLVTMVCVNPNDVAFQNPQKFIGKLYNETETEQLVASKGWMFKPSTKKQGFYCRVVPSPEPLKVINGELIENLVRQGNIVIASGGGGVPVYYDEDGLIRTLDAVIDKDLASALLANQIKADEFYILTDVSFVYKDFGKATQEKLEFLNYEDTLGYLNSGTFSEGSMAPKIRASLNFIKNGGEKSIITEAKKLADKTYGSKITMEYDNID